MKFNIGDAVRFTDNTFDNGDEIPAGTVGEVVDEGEYSNTVQVYINERYSNSGGLLGYFDVGEDFLERIDV